MDGAFASLLASLSPSAAPNFAKGLKREVVTSVTRSAPTEEVAAASGDSIVVEHGGGQVAILRRGEGLLVGGRTAADASGLYTYMRRIRDLGARPADEQPLGQGVLAAAPLSGFSVRAAFARMTQSQAPDFAGLLDTIDQQFGELLALDPQQASRLRILLEMLAVLNPDGAKALLQQISDSIRAFQNTILRRTGPGFESSVASASAQVAEAAARTEAAEQQVTTTDVIHFELDFELETSLEVHAALARLSEEGIYVETVTVRSSQEVAVHIEFTGIRAQVRQSDPIVLDLAGDGVDLAGFANGVGFDIDADGRTDRTAFVRGDDAFLALDRNRNGKIDDGGELFGDQHGAANGFDELARFDDNGDGAIDERDDVYHALRLLHDKNADGRVGLHEMSTLIEQGIASISLNCEADEMQSDLKGNRLAERAYFERGDGARGQAVDAWLGYV
jgi:hypothetical protein